MVRICLLLLLVVSSPLVHAQQTVTTKKKTAASPLSYAGRVITVTSGGGIAGQSSSYFLQDDGRLYGKRSTDQTFTMLGKQTSANTKRVFWALEDRCKIKKTRFDNPGNLYKSVIWRKGKEQYKVTWGSTKDTVPPAYQTFYRSFMAMIPTNSRLD